MTGGWVRSAMKIWWAVANPGARLVAGIVPWWVLLETRGRSSGNRRLTPLAAGPGDGESMWLIAVHGRKADWVRNIERDSQVRLRHRGRWRDATATVEPFNPSTVARFNVYARSGPQIFGLDPLLVRLRFGGEPPRPLFMSGDHSKMPRGTVMETTQLGRSTASLILRSPTTLQMA